MANDGVAVIIETQAVQDAIDLHLTRIRKATMYGLRSVGRATRTAMRAKAPTYRGPERVGVVKGELKASIKPSKNIQASDSGFTMYVGAIGKGKRAGQVRRLKARGDGSQGGSVYGVPLYRGVQEERFGYVAAGDEIAQASANAIFEAAFAKSLNT